MDDLDINNIPEVLPKIEADTRDLGFDMPSERQTGALLRCLAASKPGGRFLELGTGTGLCTAWLLDGMDQNATLVSVELDTAVSAAAARHLGHDLRLELVVADGNVWLQDYAEPSFDLIFADALPGKYENFDLAWEKLLPSGFYVIDDMSPRPNWPVGHEDLVEALLADLDRRADCALVRLAWSSGLVLAVRIAD